MVFQKKLLGEADFIVKMTAPAMVHNLVPHKALCNAHGRSQLTENVLKLLLYSNWEVWVIWKIFRPNSVISVVAKVFERITYDQVYTYPSENNIISKSQSGFRSIHSTVTALLEEIDSWAFDIDHANVNAVVLHHTILPSKEFKKILTIGLHTVNHT